MTANIAFIFDMDGTIVDNMRVHNQTWQIVMADEGVQIDIDDFNRQTTGKKTPEILRLYLGERATEVEIQRISEKKENIYRQVFRPYLRAIAGLPGFLEETRKLHIPVALATSAGKPSNSRKCSKIDAFLLYTGLLFTSMALNGAFILRVSKEGDFISLLPAGNVLVGKGFLSLQAYLVA